MRDGQLSPSPPRGRSGVAARLRLTASLCLLIGCVLVARPSAGEEAPEPEAAARGLPVSQVTRWVEAPAALVRSYRTARLVQGAMSVTTGTLAATSGALELAGVTNVYKNDDTVLGSLLLTGGLSSATVGILQLVRPISDAELRAQALVGSDDTDAIRAWVEQRRVFARRARTVRAVTIGATGAGLMISAALVQDPDAASDVAGFEALAGADANIGSTRRALVALGGATLGFALFTGLRPGVEDRIARRIDRGADPGAVANVTVGVGFDGRATNVRIVW